MKIWKKGSRVLVACQPKSGSTFLASCIGHALHVPQRQIVPGWERREQELEEGMIRKSILSTFFQGGFVSQNHVRFSRHTSRMLDTYSITPVVTVRNLYDVVASIRDHLRNEDFRIPMAYFAQNHLELDDADLEAMIARLAIPWYLNFYLSWRECPNAIWVNYEDMRSDTKACLVNICTRLGTAVSAEQLDKMLAVVKSKKTRINVGQAGRGRGISERAKNAVGELVSLYPELLKMDDARSMIAQPPDAL